MTSKIFFGLSAIDMLLIFALLFSISIVIYFTMRLIQSVAFNSRIKKTTYKNESSDEEINKRSLQNIISESFNDMVIRVHRMKIFRGDSSKQLQKSLASAGWRSRSALVIFTFSQMILPIILLITVLLIEDIPGYYQPTTLQKTLFCILAVIIGAYLPYLFVHRARKHYRAKILKSLPDCMEIMVMCLGAGYSNDAILQLIAKEFWHLAPEISGEFAVTYAELKLLPDRSMAWGNLVERVDIDEFRNVVSALDQNDRFGTSLLNTLTTLLTQLRKEKLLRAEQKAAKLPAILTIVMVFFFFPLTVILLLTPAVMQVMTTFF